MSEGTFHAQFCEGVVPGTCVVLQGNSDSPGVSIIYAGPVPMAPIIEGTVVLLSGPDFEAFCAHNEAHAKARTDRNGATLQ